MSIRHAETGRPTGHSRRDRSEDVQRITSAPAPGHIDRDARFVRYAWQMGIRTVCFILAFFTFILLATFPGWHEERDERTGSDVDVKPFPSRPVSQVALALIFISSIFVLVSVLWQHTASVAAATIAQDLGNGSVKSGVGTSAMVLGWFGFVLLIIVTIGLLVMIISIVVLDRLTDD